MSVIASLCLASCNSGDLPTTVENLATAGEACQAVERANALMASDDSDNRNEGEALASEIRRVSIESDEIANWIRRQCGEASLEMAYEAGLSINGILPDQD